MTSPVYPRISRRQDALVTRIRQVAKGAGPNGAVLIDGPRLLLDALRAGIPVDLVLASNDRLQDSSDDAREWRERAEAMGVAIHEATTGVIDAASPARTPSGVVAIARWSPSPIEVLWTPPPAFVIGLVDVQDPGNAGAVVRSADGLGATGVVMVGATADPGSAKALRGAMGSTFRVPVARASIGETLRAAKTAGLQIAATTAPSAGTVDLHHADLSGPMIVLLGNEGAGLPDRVLRAADLRISIAMRPGINSFNVAVTSALVLYEARLQRSTA